MNTKVGRNRHTQEDSPANMLPYDGIARYHGRIFEETAAAGYVEKLLNTISWQSDEIRMFGKRHMTRRKIAWFADAGLSYAYSGTTRHPHPWTEELLILKSITETRTRARFNACLLNLYHDGSEAMGWHSDNEKELVTNTCIASLSFGAERTFRLRHRKTHQMVSVTLEHGSLLTMEGITQTCWQHSLPRSPLIHTPRINLTFRLMTAPANPS